jgi:hypothetical protein
VKGNRRGGYRSEEDLLSGFRRPRAGDQGRRDLSPLAPSTRLYVCKAPFAEFNDRIVEERRAAFLDAAGGRSTSFGLA